MDKRLANLKSFKPTWKHGKTRTIRVPVALADQILEYARILDASDTTENGVSSDDTVVNGLSEILTKVGCKETGYKSNSASRLIRDLKSLVDS